MKRIMLATLLLSLLLVTNVQAAPAKTCWKISHGSICYINGHFYSIRCQSGYRVDPPGLGHRCVKVVRP